MRKRHGTNLRPETNRPHLDKPAARMIIDYMRGIEKLENPRLRGKQLPGSLAELWRYQVEDYRVLCKIQDDVLIILVVESGDRKNIYKTT